MNKIRFLGCVVFCLFFSWQVHGNVLTQKDIQAYKKVFELQKLGQLKKAQQKEREIKNPLLMGYVLYQRYFAQGYKTKKDEIRSWMKRYSDYPVATEVYALGQQKKVSQLPRPKGLFGGNTSACENIIRLEPGDLTKSLLDLSGVDRIAVQKILRQFNKFLIKGNTLNAKNLLNDSKTQKILNKKTMANAQTALAFSYFLDARDDLAREQLNLALKNAAHPMTNWLDGLVSWRMGDYPAATQAFIQAAEKSEEPSLKSASSFWAARALMRVGRFDEVGKYLQIASEFPRYFYGVLAMRSLGQDLNHSWEQPSYADESLTASFSHPALERFYALRQTGQEQWALEELSKLYLEADSEGQEVLWSISRENGFEKALQNLTGILDGENTRYPIPDWKPEGNWQLDKALVYAFVRQESCFNHRAESAVGAMGLMQIMPATAKEVASNLQCEYKTRKLKNPEYNLRLGQAYLKKLLDLPQVQNNLIKLAVAYNAGPGNLNRWEKKMDYQGDPLLFLETIPSKETRTFVERILVNYWVYLNLTGMSMPSLDEIVSGHWPMYQMCPV